MTSGTLTESGGIELQASAGSSPCRDSSPRGHGARILLPFTATSLTRGVLESAIRLAGDERAALVPAYLAVVPGTVPLDRPLPRRTGVGRPLLEAVSRYAAAAGVPARPRLAAGRSHRDALGRLLGRERWGRIVISACGELLAGELDDLRWLLAQTDTEVMLVRPRPAGAELVTAANLCRR